MTAGEEVCTISRVWQRYRGHLVALFVSLAITALIVTFRRELADLAKARVYRDVGVRLEEEVLYLGDWSRYRPFA